MRKSFFILLLLFLLLLILDNPVREIIAYIRIPFLIKVMGWVSYFGKGWIQAVFSICIMMAGLLVKKDSKMAEAGKKGLYGVALSGILVQSLKFLIGRPRPKIMDAVGFSLGPSITSGFDSFPSGHATSAFVLASVMTFYYPWMKYPFYFYAVLVSFSRIYINAHFSSDVFAGILLGLWIGRIVCKKGERIFI